jgi:PKD repeat protein
MKTIKTIILALAMISVIVGGSAAIAAGTLSASFMANVNTGAAPLTVHFTDTSDGSPAGWYWDFGDNSSSTLKDPVYTFNTPGRYTVTLTVTKDDQSDTTSADIEVTNPLAATPTPTPTTIPVIIRPVPVPVKDPHHPPGDYNPPHNDKPDKKHDKDKKNDKPKKPTATPAPKPDDGKKHK